MTIYFSEVFRTLRKNRDLTQEQIAEILGVSPQAVSRWETGATYPDIALLPTIAEFFEITVDELLGTNQEKIKRRIDDYMNRFQDAISRGEIDDCIEIMRVAVCEFPNDFMLLSNLMYVLYVASEDEDACKRYDDEIISIGERILNYCHDGSIRMEAKQRLFRHYCDTNRRAKALEIAKTLPESCREINLYWALEGEERLNCLRNIIMSHTNTLLWAIWAYASRTGTPDEKIKYLHSLQNIEEIIYECGDYGFEFYKRLRVSAMLAGLYGEMRDKENCLVYAEKAGESAVSYVTLPDQFFHKSPLIFGIEFNKKHLDTSDKRNLCQELYEDYFNIPEFDLIRQDDRFKALEGSLKSYF